MPYLVERYADPATHPDYDIVVVSILAEAAQASSYPPSDRLAEMADPFLRSVQCERGRPRTCSATYARISSWLIGAIRGSRASRKYRSTWYSVA